MIGRRGFITGLISLVAAPAIVRVSSIMPVKAIPLNELTLKELDQYWLALAEKAVNPPYGTMMHALPRLTLDQWAEHYLPRYV